MNKKSSQSDVEPIGQYPKREAREHAYDVTEALVASIPGAGPALQKLLQVLGFDPYAKREREFVERLAEVVTQLQNDDRLNVERLRDDPYFEGVVNDIREAYRTARTEAKKELLMNVVANSASGISLNDVLAGRFLSLLEQYSQSHVQMLRLLQNPSANENVNKLLQSTSTGGLLNVIEAAFPNDEIPREAIEIVYADLEKDNLVEGRLHMTVSGSGLAQKRTTGVGDAFLQFIQPVGVSQKS
ncbi:MAG: hypothetical protein RLO18_32725 [Gimesia chilikensis]